MTKYPPVLFMGALMIVLAAMFILITALVGAYFWQWHPEHEFDPGYALALWWMPLVSAAVLTGIGVDMLRSRRVRLAHYAVVAALCVLLTLMAGPFGVLFGVGAIISLRQVAKHDAWQGVGSEHDGHRGSHPPTR